MTSVYFHIDPSLFNVINAVIIYWATVGRVNGVVWAQWCAMG